MKRAVVSILLLSVVAALLALGTWQVERRAWKHALVARVEAGLKAAPVEAPAVVGPEDAYRRVTATGLFLPGKDSFVQASTIRGPGWWVMTPLRIIPRTPPRFPGESRGPAAQRRSASETLHHDDRRDWAPASAGEASGGKAKGERTILVNRGFVPERRASPVGAQPVTITGLIRLTEPGGGFLRSNDPVADRWYSRDVAAIAAKRGIAVAPYFIDADASANRPGQPIAGLTVIRFPDNHLVYAITWYVLALMTFAGFLYWRRTA